jgi:hypothetical protein
MNTINNTSIVEAKTKLTKTINEILQSGMPIAVLDLMIDIVSSEVKVILQNHLKQEAQQLADQEQVESEQIEWIPEETA